MARLPRRIQRAIDDMEPQLRTAFLDAVADIRSEAQLSVIAGALAEGRIEDAVRAVGLSAAFYAPLDDALRAAYIRGGRDALIGLPAIADPFPRDAWLSALTAGIRARNRG